MFCHLVTPATLVVWLSELAGTADAGQSLLSCGLATIHLNIQISDMKC